MTSTSARAPRFRFDRHELAGAFGDIGTDLPLLIALVATCKLDVTGVCVSFGGLQIVTGILYGIPMPVQPLKAMAAIMIAQRLSPSTLAGGGLVIGAIMLALTVTGLLDAVVRLVPKQVVRGIQLGLGITLASLALGMFGKDGAPGYALSIISVVALLALRGQRRVPAPLVVMTLGLVYAAAFKLGAAPLTGSFALRLPDLAPPTTEDLRRGALLLALPQLPLSLGNSVIATSQTSRDLFPDRSVSVRKIGFTYGLMNLIAPWFGGVPVCHGCGGLVGFYGFGARTGAAPVLYGSMYVVLGLFCAPGFDRLVGAFPMPVLGVVLLFEAVSLMMLVRDVASDKTALWIALAVAAAVVGLPYGYAVGMLTGSLIAWGIKRGWLTAPVTASAGGD